MFLTGLWYFGFIMNLFPTKICVIDYLMILLVFNRQFCSTPQAYRSTCPHPLKLAMIMWPALANEKWAEVSCQFRVEAFKYSFSTFQPTFFHYSNCQHMGWLGSVMDWIKLGCWANTQRKDALAHCLGVQHTLLEWNINFCCIMHKIFGWLVIET